ncbi:MAG: ABC transporter ATP-binding protein [Desulfobacterales bacterium]|nr:MAG: ABC transporter ATP-binding protein [Desulfobacterales bacterium]
MVESDALEPDELFIDLDNICFAYPGREIVIDHLNFQMGKGQRLGLVGSNGSGKSTLLHLIMGLHPPDAGTMRLFGKSMNSEQDFKTARRRMGFVFQNADDQLFSPTVIEDVAFGLLNMGKSPEEAVELSKETLRSLGLGGFEERVTYKLSGGEKKLVSLATVLVMQPDMLLLDEPTTGLDEKTVTRIIALLNELDIGYLIVSHEFDFIARTTTDIYTMANGQIHFKCKSDQFQQSRLPDTDTPPV